MNSISPAKRNATFIILAIVAMVSFIDRQVFTLFQDDIKSDLGLSDGQLGLLSGVSFALFYTLASFPIARYADRGDRRRTIGICVTVWSLATTLCGFATSFWTLILARVGLAAGEAGAGPASNSLLTEIFPLHRRSLVISSQLSAGAAGISGGLALAGWLSQWFDWRTVFMIVGLPGIILGLVVLMFIAEPRRQSNALKASLPEIPGKEVVRTIFSNTSLRWVALVLSMVPVTGFALILWGASFFQRVHGMNKAETGYWLGGAMAIALVIGNLVAGWVSDRFGKADPLFNGWFAGLGLLGAFPFGLGFAFSPDPYVALGCFVVVKFMMTFHLSPLMAMSFAQVPTPMRATLSAAISMVIGLSGMGIGGTMAGYVSDAFIPTYGDKSLQPALAVMTCCLVIGGIGSIMAGRTAKPLPEGS